MSITQGIVLAAASACAGGINAIAGGGTLLTFPVLLFLGAPPVIANATNTFALTLGTAGSLYGFRRHIGSVQDWLARFIPVSAVGALLGAILLTLTRPELFAKLAPGLLLFATIIFLSRDALKKLVRTNHLSGEAKTGESGIWIAVSFQFLVAVYGGYFGAGIGILMLACLGFIGLEDIHEMNAIKNVLSSVINTAASVYFIYKGMIDWPKAGIMTVGAVLGYFLGAHYSQQISQRRVRHIITAIGLGLSTVLFYKQFR